MNYYVIAILIHNDDSEGYIRCFGRIGLAVDVYRYDGIRAQSRRMSTQAVILTIAKIYVKLQAEHNL